MTVIGKAELDSFAATNKLRPDDSAFVGKPGYSRRYRKDGTYSWKYKFKPNEGGKLTRDAGFVGEVMAPYARATTERQLNAPKRPHAMLRDKDGGVRLVDPALAEKTARERGWSHAWRAGGIRVERGVDGELWRHYADGTREPTGRWCLGTPFDGATVPEGGNPDGTMRAE